MKVDPVNCDRIVCNQWYQ